MSRPLKPRILAVDDELTVGKLLRTLLERTGNYIVEVETDPFRAVEKARAFRPDLVVLDVNMPGRSGIEVAAMLRNEPWLRHLPIVFFTGMLETAQAALKAASEGPVAFVVKGEGGILETVERLVSERLTLYRALAVAENS
jgi:CheY-like chemotaxis protein